MNRLGRALDGECMEGKDNANSLFNVQAAEVRGPKTKLTADPDYLSRMWLKQKGLLSKKARLEIKLSNCLRIAYPCKASMACTTRMSAMPQTCRAVQAPRSSAQAVPKPSSSARRSMLMLLGGAASLSVAVRCSACKFI